MNVGILGGAFNPPTIGHIELAKKVLTKTNLDTVWLVPSFASSQKNIGVTFNDRVVMCELATMELENISVSSAEYYLQEKSYTFHLMQHFLTQYPHYRFHFIIGMDQANNIGSWYKSRALRNTIPFIILHRKGVDPAVGWINEDPHIVIDADLPEISSTHVREDMKNEKIRNKSSYKYLEDIVFKYIKATNLYETKTNMC